MPVPRPDYETKVKWIKDGTPWEKGMKILENIWLLGTLVRLLAGRKITLESYHDTKNELEL